MSTINHDITDEELRDLFDAGIAVFSKELISEDDAIRKANDYAYAVFRNIFTVDGYRTWLLNRAKLLQIG
jgi:hypothetical protein